jgi:serine O-acetyltransferase
MILSMSKQDLVRYINRQIGNFFPEEKDFSSIITTYIDEALERILFCINSVKMWKKGIFNPIHSSQYAIFFYYLSNSIWRKEGEQDICPRLFFLNKALNGIDLFYEVQMPEIFFIGHSVGIVLAKATYSNYLVLYQNSTVGKNHGISPILEERVVLYPNTAVIGRCHIKPGTVISQGVSLINSETPGNCFVFQGQGKELIYKDLSRDVFADIFRYE